MKAAVYRQVGAARDVLHLDNVDRPEPKAGEVRIRVHISGVNPTDYKIRSGATPRPIEEFQIPHQDGAGVIDAVGAGVNPARVGEAVWIWFAATRRWGTAAEWTVVPEEQAVALPRGASMELGASLGVPAITAHRCLLADGPITGKSVLVAGGAGAVGHFAIELAHFCGARVATTVSSDAKARMAAAAGADLVVNYRRDDAGQQLREFAEHIDRIVEVNLPANFDLDLSLAGPETTIVTFAATAEDPRLPVRACMSANLVLRFVLIYGLAIQDLLSATEDITRAIAAHALTELPVHRFALDDVVSAHEAVEAGVVGKVLVDTK
ncbi:MAG: NADPH:quinone reductase [Acidimicrobiales bacterium]|jgi:NADPH2:quinone reductase